MKALGLVFLLVVAFGGGVYVGLSLAGESPEDFLQRQLEKLNLEIPSVLVPVSTPTTSIPSPLGTLEVYRTEGLGLRVRSAPAVQDYNILGKTFDGTWLTALSESHEADGYTFAKVLLEGWVAASWLSPAPSLGATVQVQGTGGAGLRVRTAPQTVTGDILGKVFDGTWLQVLEGPHAADGDEWWRVRLEGWAASRYLRQLQVASTNLPPSSSSKDRRFIVIGGMCTSTDELTSPGHEWMPGLRWWLSHEFDKRDRPVGDSGDELILFSYSPNGWNVGYNQGDTFRHIPDVSQNLKAIYDAYPEATFDVIAHSLGGVVALYFVSTAEESDKLRTNSVVTVDSPVNGRNPGEFTRMVIAAWPSCPGRVEIEALTSQLEPGRLVPTIISRVTKPDWQGPKIVTVTNIRDLVVPTSSATLEGRSVYCAPMDAGGVLQTRSLVAPHSIILEDLPLWFQNVVRLAHRGGLKAQSCL